MKVRTRDAIVGLVALAFAGLFIEGNIDFVGLPLAGVGLYYILKLSLKKETPPTPPK